ncbi:MAG: sporulation protein [Fusicatenibacter sp.]|nr:sporulation protein [Fusicatenibacter sp.]
MPEIILLVVALVLDTFAAGVGYGSDGIWIPWKMAVLLNLICSLTLALAMGVGKGIGILIPPAVSDGICFVSFLILGGIKLFDYFMKQYINRRCGIERSVTISMSQLSVVIQVYANPMKADLDQSKDLSFRETLFLSFAMSVDGIVSAPFAAMLGIPVIGTAAAAFFTGMLLMYAGYFLGKALQSHRQCDLSFIGGLAFLFLAATKCSLWS